MWIVNWKIDAANAVSTSQSRGVCLKEQDQFVSGNMLVCLSVLFCNLAISDYYIFMHFCWRAPMNDPSHVSLIIFLFFNFLKEQMCSFCPSQSNFTTLHIPMLCPRIWWRWCFGRRILENLRSGSAWSKWGEVPATLRVLAEVLPRYAIVDSLARFFGSPYSFFWSPIWTFWKGYGTLCK